MDQDNKKQGLINLAVLLAVGVCSAILAGTCQAWTAQPSLVFFGVGVLVAAVSYFQMRLVESERLEQLEVDELKKSSASSALFSQEEDVYPAARSRAQFDRWFVPGFSLLLMGLQAGAALWLWRRLGQAEPAPVASGNLSMALLGLLGLVLFVLGKYSAGLARIPDRGLLRPGAGYIMLGAYLSFLTALAIAAHELGFKSVDLYTAKALVGLVALSAIETGINLVLELYRPRVKGGKASLLYESRLVGLLGQPGGLVTTAAHALDYQFGFKVSETWFYQFLEKALARIVLLQAGVLFLSTAFVIVEPHEQGLLTHLGKPPPGREVLQPGFHFKWPWPIDKVQRHRTREVRSFTVGGVPDDESEAQRVAVWTRAHYKEEFNLLVASREQVARSADSSSSDHGVPVNLLTVSIPVQYQITNIYAWTYNHANGAELLQRIASREIVRQLVNVDIDELMTTRRLEASETLRARIQRQADERGLGALILQVGLQDIHPPIGNSQVKVAEAYEAVIGALQERETNVLAAKAYLAERVPLAQAEATNLVTAAIGESAGRIATAAAEAAVFGSQSAAYQSSPAVYRQRSYLETLVRASAKARKYVLATTNNNENIWLNLEEKIRPDLLDVTQPKEEKR